MNSLIKEWGADVMCLQESKIEGDILEMVQQLWGGRWIRHASLDASGTRRGILVMWDERKWKGEILEIGMYTISCKFYPKY